MTSDSDIEPTGSEEDPVASLLQELPEEEGHRASERVSVVIAAVVVLAVAVTYLVVAFGYKFGSLDQPGPALFPVIIGFGLVAVSIGLLVEGLRTPKDRKVVWPYLSGAIRLAVAIVAGIVYIAITPVIGQFLAGTLLCAALLWAMRLKHWWLIVLLSVAFSAGVEYLFGVVLSVPLPRGPFWF